MLVFVDASGDPGRKILNQSSRFFIVAMVAFDEPDASSCNDRIDRLRDELGLPLGYEFHFSNNSRKIRRAFLGAISLCKFSYHVYALDKNPDVLTRLGLHRNDSLLNYVLRSACESAIDYLKNAKVVIDGRRGDRTFRNGLRIYLSRTFRSEQCEGLIREVRVRDSRKDNLLQVADFVAGVTNRLVSNRADGTNLYAYLESHPHTLDIWPKI